MGAKVLFSQFSVIHFIVNTSIFTHDRLAQNQFLYSKWGEFRNALEPLERSGALESDVGWRLGEGKRLLKSVEVDY